MKHRQVGKPKEKEKKTQYTSTTISQISMDHLVKGMAIHQEELMQMYTELNL